MQFDRLKRREFILFLGGAAAWPGTTKAQQTQRMRRVAVLMSVAADDAEGQSRITAFGQGLQEFGWSEGRNVRVEYRWAAGDADNIRRYAAELAGIKPDVIVGSGTPTVMSLRQATSTIPVVFVQVADPVGAGLVESLPRPGGNLTGFTNFEYSLSGKWLELLKEIAPAVRLAGVIRDPISAAGIGQFAAIQSAASSRGVELRPVGVQDSSEIERGIIAIGKEPNAGLIVTQSGPAIFHRKLITTLAGRHRIPAVYSLRHDVLAGGLISYGPDSITAYRLAAGYVDRILKGEKPADLPVQAATTFELVINLKTAKTLGLEVPPMLLARADEVIE